MVPLVSSCAMALILARSVDREESADDVPGRRHRARGHRRGAVGYLLKGADGEDILAAVRSAAAGQAVFGAALAQRLRTLFGDGPRKSAASFPQLTERERLILDKLAAGLTNVEIGRALFLSPKTVANNVSVVLAKLNLSERGQAIVLARDAGLGRSG